MSGIASAPSDSESASNVAVKHTDGSIKKLWLACVGVELGVCERHACASKH